MMLIFPSIFEVNLFSYFACKLSLCSSKRLVSQAGLYQLGRLFSQAGFYQLWRLFFQGDVDPWDTLNPTRASV